MKAIISNKTKFIQIYFSYLFFRVTREHRENLSKNAKAIFIRHRDEIKDIRNKAVKTLKKRNDISEDTIHRAQGQIEALCEKYLKEAETILDTKQNELLGSSE